MTSRVHSKIRPGKIINGYEVISLIGAGGFGGVYRVKDKKTSQMFAMKTENMYSKKKSLPDEIKIMRNIEGEYFPKLRTSGTDNKLQINYYVMNIYGPSLSMINQYHNKKLDLKVAYPICFELIDIIEKFHSFGFIHRDIKPANFLIQQTQNHHIVLIDFGLSERHIDPTTNQPFPFKDHLRFSGTRKYASIYAHKGYQQGRRDDLMSWFYSFMELAYGPLPWHLLKDNGKILQMKENLDFSKMPKIPHQISEIYSYILSLKYEDLPDYDRIKMLFGEAMTEIDIDPNAFNWPAFIAENYEVSNMQQSSKSHGNHKKNRKKGKERQSHSVIANREPTYADSNNENSQQQDIPDDNHGIESNSNENQNANTNATNQLTNTNCTNQSTNAPNQTTNTNATKQSTSNATNQNINSNATNTNIDPVTPNENANQAQNRDLKDVQPRHKHHHHHHHFFRNHDKEAQAQIENRKRMHFFQIRRQRKKRKLKIQRQTQLEMYAEQRDQHDDLNGPCCVIA